MPLSSSQLEAFAQVAKTRNFSKAAQNLHVTQSALSQRIINLEGELATALIIRDPAGLRLTAAGEELLRYCHVKESLETEFLSHMSSARKNVGGVIRIAAFSSVMRSVIMPALDDLISDHANINIELFVRELRDLPRMLASNEVDLIVTATESSRQDIVSHSLGFEENVLVERSKGGKPRSEVYLDHDPEDLTTASFYKLNGQPTKALRRNYLDEVYSIMDGVKRGWGRAVLPKHLVKDERDLRIVAGHKPLKVPVLLQYFRQPYYSKIHTRVVDDLCKKAPTHLQAKA